MGALLVVLVAAAAATLSGVADSASTGGGQGSFASERYGFSATLPPGWRRAESRLVPRLLSPREILSVGTFPMPVGGGGNCGREPIAAIERMQSGDVLVSIQEYTVSAAMRARIGTPSAPSPRLRSVKELGLRKQPHRQGDRIPAEEALWSATLPFTDGGRWFDALVYLKGDLRRAGLRQARSILERVRFRTGTFVGFPES